MAPWGAVERAWKPFNPILGETFELELENGVRYLAEQVGGAASTLAGLPGVQQSRVVFEDTRLFSPIRLHMMRRVMSLLTASPAICFLAQNAMQMFHACFLNAGVPSPTHWGRSR